ncbi:MAG: putative lipoprotein, partial [Labilithrix sp.]|nr:putative lipoprotein [Labilithrix sp.]
DYDDLVGGCSLPLTPALFDGSLQSHVCAATASNVSVELFYRIRQP